MAIKVLAAINSPHFTYSPPIKPYKPTGKVLRLSLLIITKAYRNSRQLRLKQKIADVAIPGSAKGSIIILKTKKLLAPSTLAASSISMGIVLKNETNNHIANGKEKVI